MIWFLIDLIAMLVRAGAQLLGTLTALLVSGLTIVLVLGLIVIHIVQPKDTLPEGSLCKLSGGFACSELPQDEEQAE